MTTALLKHFYPEIRGRILVVMVAKVTLFARPFPAMFHKVNHCASLRDGAPFYFDALGAFNREPIRNRGTVARDEMEENFVGK